MWQLAAFGCALVLFHGSEFLLAAVFMRNQLSLRCELLQLPAGLSRRFAAFRLQPPSAAAGSVISINTALLFSWPYTCAMAAGVAEFLLEAALLPALKQSHLVSCAGLALVFAGEALRKAAMVCWCVCVVLHCLEACMRLNRHCCCHRHLTCACVCPQVTAASNFTHDIQTVKRPTHTLITHGIYRCV
jgi:hypothetical protein